MNALIVSADNFEDTELLVPYYRLKEEGIDITVASMRKGKIKGKHGYEVEVDRALSEIDATNFDLLFLPGGKAPEAVRKEKGALAIVKQFFKEKKPVFAICHGPQILISAGVMKGRAATCYRTVAQELMDSGAKYFDKEVVVDQNLATSRQPSDLPALMKEMIRKTEEVKK
jgi:protease I